MQEWLEQFLVRYRELALFLVISAGYWIGSFKFGEFSGRDRNVEELLVLDLPRALRRRAHSYPVGTILLMTCGTIIVVVMAS